MILLSHDVTVVGNRKDVVSFWLPEFYDQTSVPRIKRKSTNIWEAIILKKQRRDNQKTENMKQKNQDNLKINIIF
jgi:hypothetical protein